MDIRAQINYYRQQLRDSPIAIEYLRSRGITSETANYFEIGYAPHAPLFNALCEHRIVLPVKDTMGDYVAFVGRIIDKEDTRSKYWNSWESAEYQKGRILFGFADSFPQILAMSSVILVEGQFDFLTLWQNGIRNVVACSGTSFTPVHARLLARYADTVYVAFDADSAGEKGRLTAQTYLERLGVRVISVKLLDGEDPDSFIKKYGAQEFLKYLQVGL